MKNQTKENKVPAYQKVENPNGTIRHEYKYGRVVVVENKRDGVYRKYVRDGATNEPVLKKEGPLRDFERGLVRV